MPAQKRQRDESQHEGHQNDSHHDDLMQRSMEQPDAQHQSATKDQLQPAGVGNAPRHLIRNEHHAERIQRGGGGIERKQPADFNESRTKDNAHDQMWKESSSGDEYQ